jgi:hypothetical protein
MGQEKQASPEEKLLKVIQGGGEAPSSSAKDASPRAPARTAAAPTPRAEKPVPTPAAKPEKASSAAKQDVKSKLKVAASDQAPTSSATPKPANAASAKPATPAALAAGAATHRKRPKRKVNLRTVNFSLAAIVLVILFLLGYEIWAAIETSGQDTRVVVPRLPGGGTEVVGPAQLVLSKDILDKFEARPLIGGAAVPTNAPPAGTTTAWILYARDNLKLAAFIGNPGAAQKAVIIDKKLDSKMIFVKLGDKIAAGDQEVTVKEFQSDKVILFDGAQKQAVK